MSEDNGTIRLIDYLPAIYRQHPFLEEFLHPFEQVLFEGWELERGSPATRVAPFNDVLAMIGRYFIPINNEEPDYQTDPEFLPWLAAWVALVLDPEWDEEKCRLLISRAVELYLKRGTVDGLKEYLEIYTGTRKDKIDIRECMWPAGMQIGVASKIGGIEPRIDFAKFSVERLPPRSYDYYVISQCDPKGIGCRVYYYRKDMVQSVEVDIDQKTVRISYVLPDGYLFTQDTYDNATIIRRDGLADTRYLFEGVPAGAPTGAPTATATYTGDTVLVGEDGETPYRFIIDVKVDYDRIHNVRVEKIRAIVDLEKPAHTQYYLRLIPERTIEELKPMQIAVHSTIGTDNLLG